MSLLVTTTVNNVNVFNVTPGKGIPAFLSKQERKNMQEAPTNKQRVDVLQDLTFPTLTTKARFSNDSQYFAACGCYPPMLRLYDLGNTGLKVQRNTDSEIVDFHFLSDDYQLMALVEADRNLEFHNKGGKLYKMRIPRPPRCSAFDCHTPQLIVGGVGGQIYRVDLQEGRFRTSWDTPSLSQKLISSDAFGVNALVYSPETCLTFAADGHSLSTYDARTRGGIVSSIVLETEGTAVAVDKTGLQVAAGTSESDIILYDIRSSHPLHQFTHHSDLPIKEIHFHTSYSTHTLISADSRSIRMFRPDENTNRSKLFCVIEPDVTINSFTVFPESGLLMVPCEDMVINTFYVPELGPSPVFAAFLDDLAADMSTSALTSSYEGLYFVTKDDLERVGLDLVADSSICTPYMHGFYISKALYDKAKLANAPPNIATSQQTTERAPEKTPIGTRKRVIQNKDSGKFTQSTTQGGAEDHVRDLFGAD